MSDTAFKILLNSHTWRYLGGQLAAKCCIVDFICFLVSFFSYCLFYTIPVGNILYRHYFALKLIYSSTHHFIKDYWWGFYTRNKHRVHIDNFIRFKNDVSILFWVSRSVILIYKYYEHPRFFIKLSDFRQFDLCTWKLVNLELITRIDHYELTIFRQMSWWEYHSYLGV